MLNGPILAYGTMITYDKDELKIWKRRTPLFLGNERNYEHQNIGLLIIIADHGDLGLESFAVDGHLKL